MKKSENLFLFPFSLFIDLRTHNKKTHTQTNKLLTPETWMILFFFSYTCYRIIFILTLKVSDYRRKWKTICPIKQSCQQEISLKYWEWNTFYRFKCSQVFSSFSSSSSFFFSKKVKVCFVLSFPVKIKFKKFRKLKCFAGQENGILLGYV